MLLVPQPPASWTVSAFNPRHCTPRLMVRRLRCTIKCGFNTMELQLPSSTGCAAKAVISISAEQR